MHKYNKDFTGDFSDFLAGIITTYDHVLIVGDFNIHVCCPDKPLVKDFLSLLDSFSLVQAVSGPTHEHGHTLDLVISCSLPVTNLEICDPVFSDHLSVLFSVSLTPTTVKTHAAVRRCLVINLPLPLSSLLLFFSSVDHLTPSTLIQKSSGPGSILPVKSSWTQLLH